MKGQRCGLADEVPAAARGPHAGIRLQSVARTAPRASREARTVLDSVSTASRGRTFVRQCRTSVYNVKVSTAWEQLQVHLALRRERQHHAEETVRRVSRLDRNALSTSAAHWLDSYGWRAAPTTDADTWVL